MSTQDDGSKHSVSGIEVDVMLMAQELRLQHKLDTLDKHDELHIKAQSDTFNNEITELRMVAKERHVLFVKDVKTIREDVNRKLEELKFDVAKEIN
ncbi:unnamed protein product [Lactuca saligna]|uniref:Uncharacterized protein n=1 Tax=Lactuca saligna TaxID=75948 RepID=A0AA35Y042_LACSI|nr:unnamed protein product [Lactuca saligna]